MEYTQWAEKIYGLQSLMVSLNPCCNGIYSMRPDKNNNNKNNRS